VKNQIILKLCYNSLTICTSVIHLQNQKFTQPKTDEEAFIIKCKARSTGQS